MTEFRHENQREKRAPEEAEKVSSGYRFGRFLGVGRAASARSPALRKWLILLCIWVLCGAYLAVNLKRGWVPHDEGMLAQSAERVLQGQLPHHDFVDTYTGGLGYLHALAFRLFGTNLASLRIVLFIFFMAWIPVVFFIAAEIASHWVAAGITLLVAAWSVANYSAAIPSWYNLFLATFGVGALLRYLRSPSPVWLFLAGLFGGASFLVKSVALYYIAGVLLFFVYREQSGSVAHAPNTRGKPASYSLFMIGVLSVLIVSLVVLIRRHLNPEELTQFVLPGAALSALLIHQELRGVPGRGARRFAQLCRMVVPFLVGAVIPVALFLIPTVRAAATAEFINGVFVLPEKRVVDAFMRPPSFGTLIPTLVLAASVAAGYRLRGRSRIVMTLVVLVACALLIQSSFANARFYQIAWNSIQGVTPLLALAGGWRLLRRTPRSLPLTGLAGERLMLLLSVAVFCNLVRFPFTAPIYFCYVAPLLILAAAALLSTYPKPPRLLFGTLTGFYLLFAVLLFRPGFIYTMGLHYAPDEQTAELAIPRAGGLRVYKNSAMVYEKLIRFVHEHIGDGEMFAGPDAPEVYFLTGTANPTRTIFDFFENRKVYRGEIGRLFDARPIKVVVINLKPSFSRSYLEPIRSAAVMRFPSVARMDSFEVRWRL